jgi:tRNA-Thr(GGU) m(6)t(6)A37 methyltransferase TsaA
MSQEIVLRPIGIVRSPHQQPAGTPIQPAYAAEFEGEVVLDPEFEPALADLEQFERIWLIYHLDRAKEFRLTVVPYRDTRPHGLFATRAPSRPNPIGLSVVRLLSREGHILRVAGLDLLDRTPLLDIKPYVPEFDAHSRSRAGWLDGVARRRRADNRFAGDPEE